MYTYQYNILCTCTYTMRVCTEWHAINHNTRIHTRATHAHSCQWTARRRKDVFHLSMSAYILPDTSTGRFLYFRTFYNFCIHTHTVCISDVICLYRLQGVPRGFINCDSTVQPWINCACIWTFPMHNLKYLRKIHFSLTRLLCFLLFQLLNIFLYKILRNRKNFQKILILGFVTLDQLR